MRLQHFTYVLFSALFISLIACQPAEESMSDGNLTVRFNEEPERINPILGDDGAGAQIENLIYQALFNYDPHTMEFVPQLAAGAPEITTFERDGKSYKKFSYTIREDAVWDDGKPVDAGDYLFTIKAIFNPEVAAASTRGYLGSVTNVTIHPNNRKIIEITTEGNYMLEEYAVGNIFIMPRHIYDPEGMLTGISIRDLLDQEIAQKLVESTPNLTSFAAAFNSQTYSRDVVQGSGAYKLESWEAGQQVVLSRKDNWWGDAYTSESVLFEAHPASITYKIIPDEAVAINSLKDETIDVISDLSPDNYVSIKNDANISGQFNFHTPALMQYYYLTLNNTNDKLSDKKVRQALAHSMDVDLVINDILEGLATPTVGPIHPSKRAYANDLEPRKLDLDKATSLLDEAGWKDSNGNGIRDKRVNGKLVELELDAVVSGELGRQLALILQQNADKVGFKINIGQKQFSLIRQDLWEKNYDLTAMRNRQSPAPADLYQSWHTDNMGINGSNYPGYGNAKTDSIIELIRNTQDANLRMENYKVIQEIMYEDQPVIFLAAPQANVIVRNTWESTEVRHKPGYYEPGLKLVK